MHIINSNSRTSTHWKLNSENGKVQTAMAAGGDSDLDGSFEDPLMSILATRATFGNGEWKLDASQVCSENCQTKERRQHKAKDLDASDPKNASSNKIRVKRKPPVYSSNKKFNTSDKTASNKTDSGSTSKKSHVLTCGKPVNFTHFDHLQGIAERHTHPSFPEPEVALIFKKKNKSGNHEVNMNDLEKKLRKAKKEKPKSAQVYNQIGNFWRIRGNTQMSIECFRKALSLSPNNSDVLLNLARVLFNLQFLHDAVELTRHSLATQSPDQNSWLQHFTLGEIFKALGSYSEASLHFRHTLDLNPGFPQAIAHLREMEISPDGTVTYYTLFIILLLALGVLCGILTSMDGTFDELGESIKTQRHFNRAMAMRSIKLGINHKVIRMRKQAYNT